MDIKDQQNRKDPGYEFAQLSEAEIRNLKSAEDKLNRGKSDEVVVIAYQKDPKS